MGDQVISLQSFASTNQPDYLDILIIQNGSSLASEQQLPVVSA